MELLFFILVCYGLTQIILYGSVFNKVRPRKEFLYGFGKLFHCPMCMGFHVGYAVFLLFWFTGARMWSELFSGCFIYGCLSSGTTYMLSMLIGDDGLAIKSRKE